MTSVGWLSCSQADVPAEDNWLSARERDTLAALRLPPRRTDWRLGRWTAKRAVRSWLAIDVLGDGGLVEILAAPDGAPEATVAGRAVPVALSLSHRDGVAVCAVAPGGTAIGCDLEAVEPRQDVFAADFFTPQELTVVRSAPPSLRDLVTTLVWSGKESALKGVREGLRLDTRDVVVHLAGSPGEAPQQWEAFTVTGPGDRCFDGRWRLHLGLVFTVVVPAPWDADPIELAELVS
ncbi:MAG: 4'-phosphopantetheinyl transferase superfamily protein [Acidimicrobiales bacterium]